MKTNDLTLSAIMLAVLIVCSQLFIPVGPVPITLQTFAVLMIGYSLSSKNALITIGIYVLSGLIGLPFFSAFSGGFQSILLPSFGFILSFIPAAFMQARYLEKKQLNQSKHLLIAGLINITITYLIGLAYMAFILNVYLGSEMGVVAILLAGFIPFIPGDAFKLIIALIIAKRIIPTLQKNKSFT